MTARAGGAQPTTVSLFVPSFQPTPPKRVAAWDSSPRSPCWCNFHPRYPRGWRHMYKVSLDYLTDFNPRHPRGWRPLNITAWSTNFYFNPRRLLSGGTSAKLRGGARTNRFEALFLSPAIPSGANAEGCLLATRGHPFHPTPPFERAALGNPHDLGTPFPSSQSRLPPPSRFIAYFKSVFQPTRPFRAVNKQPIDPRICYEFQPTPSTRRVTCLVVSFFCLTGSFQPTPPA